MASADSMIVRLEGAPDGDHEELDELAVQLRRELLELDVDRVERVRQQSNSVGSKSGDAIALGVLTVTLSPIALRGVFRLLEVFVKNRPVRKVRVDFGDDSIELEHVSPLDQRRLVDAFIAAHQPRPDEQSQTEEEPSGS
ncbi:hypothetical protein [Streptomyces odontomachi]|uniref:hypothetical protein n=1 Tax=Streptomyces odontomachi TaxID=2944940 RepID=UPI00210C3FD5|nr:hypothetical protein [Streptomyces sp. ODS25]